jgi:DNA polymerase I-like protein with 3'-5' exonuclease and polymerase domains
MRSLIRPDPGWGLAYIDWEQQEYGIAAALSSDSAMMEAYGSGDPYLAFAKRAEAVPSNASKQSHRFEREQFKECALGVLYRMGEHSLARKTNQPMAVARELLRVHKQLYPRFWRWSEAVVDYAMLHRRLWTTFGWNIHVGPEPNPRFLSNFPMQANGAEMLRLACCLAIERGLRVCAPIHDAILIEAPLEELEDAVQEAKKAMEEASATVLSGFKLRTEAKLVRYPDRYMDERGRAMWNTVCGILNEVKS